MRRSGRIFMWKKRELLSPLPSIDVG